MKIILTAFLLFSFPLGIQAQWSLSATAGTQQSFAGEYNVPQYLAPAYRAGVSIEVPVQAGFGFESGVAYQKKKMLFIKADIPSMWGVKASMMKSRHSQAVHQLTIPLLGSYTFRSGEHHSWSILAGMHYSFALAAYTDYREALIVGREPYYSSRNKVYLKRSFSAEIARNLTADNRPSVNLFIPSFYAGLSWTYRNTYGIRLFYEQDLYHYYLHSNMLLDNFKWQTAGILLTYRIFRA